MKLRTLILFPEEYKDTTYKGVCFHCSHQVFVNCEDCTFYKAMKELYDDYDSVYEEL